MIVAEDASGRMMLNYLETAFNVLLEPCLLYPSERSQLAKLRDKKSKLSPSTIYGGEHLLRLLLIIPRCVRSSFMLRIVCNMRLSIDTVFFYTVAFLQVMTRTPETTTRRLHLSQIPMCQSSTLFLIVSWGFFRRSRCCYVAPPYYDFASHFCSMASAFLPDMNFTF